MSCELTQGRIRNPLLGISREDLMADVELFATESGLTEMIDLLRKGALVAQNPHHIEHLPELTDVERDALRSEITHRWKQPRILYFTIILNSIAAAIQGWDQVRTLMSTCSLMVPFLYTKHTWGNCSLATSTRAARVQVETLLYSSLLI